MGQAESKFYETEDMLKIREIEKTGGAAAVYSYVKEKLNAWEIEPVKLAITGRSAAGKSTFINKISGVKPGDKDFARQGSGDTTLEKQQYSHPKYKNIHFWDLPGMGTLRMPAETYTKTMEFSNFDFFFIFFPDVIIQNDALIAKEILKQDKQFCFIRSKLDNDFDNCEDDGVTEDEKLKQIKSNAEGLLRNDDVLRNSSKVFYISGKKPEIGEMDLVVEYINNWLSEVKREAVFNALACVSERIIEEKYKLLKIRLGLVTVLTSTAFGMWVPELNFAINLDILVKEIKHYIEVFGLSIEVLGCIYSEKKIKLKCDSFLVPQDQLTGVIIQLLREASSNPWMKVGHIADCLLYSINLTTTAILVYRFLSTQLENFHEDAIKVYAFIKKQRKCGFLLEVTATGNNIKLNKILCFDTSYHIS